MLVIVGIIVVTVCVFGGYLLEGGHIHVLIQPIEMLIICGAAAGSVLIAATPTLIKDMIHQLINTIKIKETTQEEFMQVLLLMFELCKICKGNPLALEPHVEKPDASDIFKRYPVVLHNHHLIHFICDTLKVQVSSPMGPYDLEALMDVDIQVVHNEELKAPGLVTKVGDAMPGLGIVAAVLGVVITMGKLSQGKEVIGHSVAAALVGTFLGILISYGFIQPLAAKMEANVSAGGKMFDIAKQMMLALAKECSPKVCVEFGRRSIPISVRPSFEDMDKATANAGKAAA